MQPKAAGGVCMFNRNMMHTEPFNGDGHWLKRWKKRDLLHRHNHSIKSRSLTGESIGHGPKTR